MRVLVTGGAGYIGSHAVYQLLEAGHEVAVIDSMVAGNPWAVPEKALFLKADIADEQPVKKLFEDFKPEAIMHFAAFVEVPESVREPLKYYENNFTKACRFIQMAVDAGIRRFIFSSTAAVYGTPEKNPINESAPVLPINPYGASKSFTERFLLDLAQIGKISPIIFRYFNVAGARLDLKIGQARPNPFHLINVASEAALGLRPKLMMFGEDYQTKDGTCERDYIHVEDLVAAHLLGLQYPLENGKAEIFNLGYGHGFTVKEVIEVMQKLSEKGFPVEKAPRREGDPDSLVADSSKAQKILKWKPKHDNLELICQTALNWEKKLIQIKAQNKV
jgi:UDP-glucose 4-epimerase